MAMPSPTVFESASRSGFLSLDVAEEALAAAEQDREDHQPQLVDEVVLDQPLDQLGAAGDEDDAVDLALQLRDLRRRGRR